MESNPAYVKLSRQLRKDQTPWEKKLWARLKGRKFFGLKFKRQVTIGPYIYDFSCFEKKLIIELDGSEHKQPKNIAKDQAKQKFVEYIGYTVLRFGNNEIDTDFEEVLEEIRLITNQ